MQKKECFAERRLLAEFDGAFDGVFLGALDDGGDDRPAGEIATVKIVVASAAITDIQETILLSLRVMRLDDGIDEHIDRLGEREILLEIDFVNLAGSGLVGTAHADFAVNAAGAQDGGVNQVRPVRGDDDNHVLQDLQAVHLRAEHRHERGQDVGADATGVARPENGFSLVNEEERQVTFRRFLAALAEQVTNLALRFPPATCSAPPALSR